jgi:DNA repair protein RadA/Sms
MDHRRLAIDVAVLERKARVRLADRDVYVGISGGLKVSEPALDLGVCMAIASSRQEKTIPPQVVFLGEVSLTGEVRPVSRVEERLREAARLGFRHLVLSDKARLRGSPEGLEVVAVSDVRGALTAFGVC